MDVENSLSGSILTPTQRDYLRSDDDDRSDANRRMIRKRIRNRLGIGMVDLSTILRHLGDEDLDSAFIERIHYGNGAIRNSKKHIPDAVGVLYLGSIARKESLGIRGLESVRTEDRYLQTPLVNPLAFENRAAEGIERALVRRGIDVNSVSVRVDIDVAGSLEREGLDLSEVSSRVLERLKLAGEISEKEFVRERARRLGIKPDELRVE